MVDWLIFLLNRDVPGENEAALLCRAIADPPMAAGHNYCQEKYEKYNKNSQKILPMVLRQHHCHETVLFIFVTTKRVFYTFSVFYFVFVGLLDMFVYKLSNLSMFMFTGLPDVVRHAWVGEPVAGAVAHRPERWHKMGELWKVGGITKSTWICINADRMRKSER